ncbi:MAG: SMC-Scp complex subunit ScpB, partial [Elusimicrobiota bacterium]|nr:SMC-Scp complex subunit ScpB [Elusimicrobiota bacterium]
MDNNENLINDNLANEIAKIVEAMLFVSDKPLSIKEIKNVLKDDYPKLDGLEDILKKLQQDYALSDKPYEIKFVADGWT